MYFLSEDVDCTCTGLLSLELSKTLLSLSKVFLISDAPKYRYLLILALLADIVTSFADIFPL